MIGYFLILTNPETDVLSFYAFEEFFFVFDFNTAPVSFRKTFSRNFRWSTKSDLVTTSTFYVRTYSIKSLKALGDYLLKTSGMFKNHK